MTKRDVSTKNFPESPYVVPRLNELGKLYKENKQDEKAKAAFKSALQAGEGFVKAPKKLAPYDMILPDVLAYMAEAQEGLGDEKAAKKAWARVATEYRRRIKDSNDRGNNLELGHAIARSGHIKEADQHFTRLEKKYPEEHTFYYNHAYMLFDTAKDLKKAEPVAQKAYEYSYGDNHIRAAMLLAKIKHGLGDKKSAIEILEATAKAVKLPDDKANRTHRYYKQINALKEKLAG